MLKHILLPADTSAGSAAAVRTGLQFARQTGARVTILHVLPEFRIHSAGSELAGDSLDDYQRDRVAHADAMLAELAASARSLELECNTVTVHGDHPDRSIIEAARLHGCDLIAMASQGHLNLLGAMLGSVTHKVLVHSAVPVLVLR